MRVTSIDLYSNEFEVLRLNLNKPDPTAKYLVKGIVGLDADEIISRFYGFGTVSGKKYYDFSLKPREIAMRVCLNPNYRIGESNSELRDDLYRMISSSRTGAITLTLNSGATTVAGITGFITKFEVPHFSETSEVQITLRCDDPIFRGVNPVVLDNLGIVATNVPFSVPDSSSTAPHGFEMQFTLVGDAQYLIIQEPGNADWKFEMIAGTIGAGTNFRGGDVFHFSSEFTTRKLYLVRSGVTYHLMDKVTPGSTWPTVFPGSNEFEVDADNSNFVNIASIKYYPAYWGV